MLTRSLRLAVLPFAVALSSTSAAQCVIDKVIAPDGGFGDHFGASVALSGDTVVVGAKDEDAAGIQSGAAYVFRREGEGWVFQQKLVPPPGSELESFGTSVAVDGTTLVVGVPGHPLSTVTTGAAWVYERTGQGWGHVQTLVGLDTVAQDLFGTSVAVDQGRILVGSPKDDDGASGSGSAYVFETEGHSWQQTAKLTAEGASFLDEFGTSVALDGDRIAVGAPFDDALCPESWFCNSGATYVFEARSGSWDQVAKLTASDAAEGDAFGTSVAIHGTRVLVGNPQSFNTLPVGGSAYVFDGAGELWAESARLVAPDAASGDDFGISVALDGDVVLVGARLADFPINNAGAAYVFVNEGDTWSHDSTLHAQDAGSGHFLGQSVALRNGRAVLGALGDELGLSGFVGDIGSAYLFDVPGGPSLSASPFPLSVSSGGVQNLDLFAGPAWAGQPYQVLGSASGTEPGLAAFGIELPLNLDAYFAFTLANPGAPFLPNSLGVLDTCGRAQAAFALPADSDPTLAGITLHHAFLAWTPTPTPVFFTSDPVVTVLAP